MSSDDAIVDLLRQMIDESRASDQDILDRIENLHTMLKELYIDFEQHREEEADAREDSTRRIRILETAFVNSGRSDT